MRSVAAAMNLPFIDLFNPVNPSRMTNPVRPTFNGIHLTRYGNWVVAQIMMDQLGFHRCCESNGGRRGLEVSLFLN